MTEETDTNDTEQNDDEQVCEIDLLGGDGDE